MRGEFGPAASPGFLELPMTKTLRNQRPPACARDRKRGCRPPVSRILSLPLARDWTAISLTPPRRSALLAQGATNTRGSNGRATLPLFCLAPRGVCRAARVAPMRGGLLLHHFTLACALAGHRRYAFCCTFHPGPSRFPSPAFTGRAALWCPDFPHPRSRGTATVREAARPPCATRARIPRNSAAFLAGAATQMEDGLPACLGRQALIGLSL